MDALGLVGWRSGKISDDVDPLQQMTGQFIKAINLADGIDFCDDLVQGGFNFAEGLIGIEFLLNFQPILML